MDGIPVPQETAWQQSSEFDKTKTAVVVIDSLGGENGTMPALVDAADKGITIVKAARAAGIPVIFCNDAHLAGIDHEIELWGEHAMAGSEAAKPLAGFDVQTSDIIIPKRRYNSFFQTSLDITLRELGVDTLIAYGFDTNICVMHTLAGAYFLGYKTIVAGDACGTFLIGNQADGLAYFSRCFDSRVVDTATVLGYLEV